ncbi:hypothetical protein TNCT6_78620 [Streptomyces sp. 6-11-2]|nr:hypothetical protein TNCT6_78620 [Streptomyces sp. 6-11-2]
MSWSIPRGPGCVQAIGQDAPVARLEPAAHALREFEKFYNSRRPHQGIANARPLNPVPTPIADPDETARLGIRRSDRLGGVLHEYEHAA